GVVILRGKLDPPAGVQETARHPGGREAQQPFAGIERSIEQRGDVVFLSDLGGDHGWGQLLRSKAGNQGRDESETVILMATLSPEQLAAEEMADVARFRGAREESGLRPAAPGRKPLKRRRAKERTRLNLAVL